MPVFPDHIRFRNPDRCRACQSRVCVEMCTGDAITADAAGLPLFDREKCVECGACLWDCPEIDEAKQEALIHAATHPASHE